ncbi:hypothetical protein SAMN05661010_00922 [Modicisalibacter muralis]|uniref:Secreted protein n=1 Tax=Modicisalibacter muralis TaxID=119000 RepID=A0A1G9HUR4_9GAMM|nr:hypothetical protein [Halomonas muralis]SDL16565.1 hypothetical protein SAMN05661010_00922 [Halomonas muralis]
MQACNYRRATGAFGVALFALAMTTAMAQESKEKVQGEAQEVVGQCQQQALQGPAGQALTGNPIYETNAADYEPGKAFELQISFLGHGNTFHTVTCQVDEQGNVTYKGVEETGQPQI